MSGGGGCRQGSRTGFMPEEFKENSVSTCHAGDVAATHGLTDFCHDV